MFISVYGDQHHLVLPYKAIFLAVVGLANQGQAFTFFPQTVQI